MAAEQSTQSESRSRGNRRRKHIVDPVFQWKWVASIMTIVFAISAIITVVTYGVIYQAVRSATLHGGAATFGSTTLSVVLCGLGLAIGPALALGLWSIFITHRICGPLYAMERDLREISAGKFPNMRPLRKKDNFKKFHAQLWRALETLKARDDAQRNALIRAWKLATNRAGDARQVTLSAIAAELEPLVGDERNAPPASTASATPGPASEVQAPSEQPVQTAC